MSKQPPSSPELKAKRRAIVAKARSVRNDKNRKTAEFRRAIFVQEYLKHHNAAKAARAAGYKSDRYSGCVLLKDERVRAQIDEALSDRIVSPKEIVARLSEQAMGNVAEFVKPNGRVNQETMKSKGYLVKRVRRGEHGDEVELLDQQAALVILGKHYGMFRDRHEVSGPNGGPIYTQSRPFKDVPDERLRELAALVVEEVVEEPQ